MKAVRRKRSHSKTDRRGALAVEMALCLPILFTVLFGCFELAHANMLRHASESAAYEGARAGIVPGTTPEKIRTAATGVLRSLGVSNFTVSIVPEVITAETNNVRVEVDVPVRANTLIPAVFFADPTFHGQCELSRETL